MVDLSLFVDVNPPATAVARDDRQTQVSAAQQLALAQLDRVAGTGQDPGL